MKVMQSLDIIGPEIKIQIDKNDSFKSICGFLSTILLIILSILAFVGFGRDIFENQDPSTMFNKEVAPNSARYTLNTSEFTFMWTIADLQNNIKPGDGYFTSYFIGQETSPQILKETGNSLKETYYQFEKCSEKRILDDKVKQKLNADITKYYCFPENMIAPMKGNNADGNKFNLKMVVDICVNTTANNNSCKPPEEIVKYLSAVNMYVVFSDTIIDNYNYTDPGQRSYVAQIITSNPNTFARNVFLFKNVRYYTDQGWILEERREQKYFALDSIGTVNLPQFPAKSIFSHIITMTNTEDVYYRKYIKIQGVAAYIGGFITFFKFILSIFNYYYIYPDFVNYFHKVLAKKKHIKTTTKFNNFISDNNQDKQDKTSVSNNLQTNNLLRGNQIDLTKIPKRSKEEPTKQLEFNCVERLLRKIPCKTPKLKQKYLLFHNFNEMTAKFISLKNLIKVQKNVELLKYLLLSEDQQVALKYICFTSKKYNLNKIDECLDRMKNDNNNINNKILSNLSLVSKT
jgi:hypothetical protein